MIRRVLLSAIFLFGVTALFAEVLLEKAPRELGFRPRAPVESVPLIVSKSSADDEAISQLGTAFVSSGKSDALSIAIIRGEEVRFYNFGSVSPQRKILPTEHSLFEIGSITKVFTALLLAHAVTESRIGLYDDVRQYLPGNYPKLAFEGTPVRIVDLANTTSALPDNLPDFSQIGASAKPGTESSMIVKAWSQYNEQSFLEDLKSIELVRCPGVVPRHSNVAAALLGVILKRVYGDSYGALLGRYIEQPFRMGNGIDDGRSALLVTGYDMQHKAMPAISGAYIMPAGGLRYSSFDLANFLKAELVAPSEAVRLSQEPAWGNPNSVAVGLGWRISKTSEGKLHLYASGGTFGSSSYIGMYPASRYGIVLLANQAGKTEEQLTDLADALSKRLLKESSEK